jgi:hypothetical protein
MIRREFAGVAIFEAPRPKGFPDEMEIYASDRSLSSPTMRLVSPVTPFPFSALNFCTRDDHHWIFLLK